MSTRPLRLCTALTGGLLLAGIATANPFETTLDNGLKVIVKEDTRAPSAVHMVWYRAGAMDEPEGVSGIAHMLEHMMFKGTETVGPGEFNQRVAARGGRDNAFTSRDYTAYFQQIPPQYLGEMMALEADRMSHLKIDDALFRPEVEVVKEERRLRIEDQPMSLLAETAMATAYQSHPYRRPVIGWMDDIQHYTLQDALDWYQSWYTPANAIVVVVGDVKHEEVFAAAREHYGAIPVRALPERRDITEAPQRGQRTASVEAPADMPYLWLSWRAPTLREVGGDRDVYALQMLASVLGGYDGARLPRRLVRERRLATYADASFDGVGRGPAMFSLGGAPAAGVSVADLEAALLAEIADIQQNGIGEDELARVRTQATAQHVYKRDSLMGQAMEIGSLEASGYTWRDDETMLEQFRSVTAVEVRAVAQKYFTPASQTRAELIPQKLAAAPAADASQQPAPLDAAGSEATVH